MKYTSAQEKKKAHIHTPTDKKLGKLICQLFNNYRLAHLMPHLQKRRGKASSCVRAGPGKLAGLVHQPHQRLEFQPKDGEWC